MLRIVLSDLQAVERKGLLVKDKQLRIEITKQTLKHKGYYCVTHDEVKAVTLLAESATRTSDSLALPVHAQDCAKAPLRKARKLRDDVWHEHEFGLKLWILFTRIITSAEKYNLADLPWIEL